jgi:hypothetical protein
MDVLLFYIFSSMILFYFRVGSFKGLILIFMISVMLFYVPYQITVIRTKNGPGFVKECLIDGVNKSSKEKLEYSYENSCVFLSDMHSGWRAKYYWVW